MNLSDFFKVENLICDLKAQTKEEVFQEFADLLERNSVLKNKGGMLGAIAEREKLGSTGIGDHIAIPHAKLKELTGLTAAFGLSKKGINFNSLDRKPVHFVFLLLASENSAVNHLKALARISRIIKGETFRSRLLNCSDPKSLYDLFIEEDSKVV